MIVLHAFALVATAVALAAGPLVAVAVATWLTQRARMERIRREWDLSSRDVDDLEALLLANGYVEQEA